MVSVQRSHADGISSSASALSRCSVCEMHDSAGEPGAGKRHAGFGERLLETETMAWTEALANGESHQQQFPPSRLRYTALVADSTPKKRWALICSEN